jgi:hypothetical protein
MRITNNTRETQNFIIRGKPKDGVPPTGHVPPGETVDLDVDPNDPTLRGAIFAGAVTVPASVAEKVEAAAAAPPAGGKSR